MAKWGDIVDALLGLFVNAFLRVSKNSSDDSISCT